MFLKLESKLDGLVIITAHMPRDLLGLNCCHILSGY